MSTWHLNYEEDPEKRRLARLRYGRRIGWTFRQMSVQSYYDTCCFVFGTPPTAEDLAGMATKLGHHILPETR